MTGSQLAVTRNPRILRGQRGVPNCQSGVWVAGANGRRRHRHPNMVEVKPKRHQDLILGDMQRSILDCGVYSLNQWEV